MPSQNIRNDFPIFHNRPNLVYLDNAATVQKPQKVIDDVNYFLTHNYANIHRGRYEISEISEEIYYQTKKKVANFINAKSWEEIIFCHNSTNAFNLLANTLGFNKILGKGDKILLSIAEHHANIVPRQIAAEIYGFEIDFVKLDEGFTIDVEDFKKKYDNSVKVVSMSGLSNSLGVQFDLKNIKNNLREDTIFIVDGSQDIVHNQVDVQDLGCDFYVFTGHKIMAYTGIGVIYGKKEKLKSLNPARGGGGTVMEVGLNFYKNKTDSEKREPGTPNLIGAVSLNSALDYFASMGGYKTLQQIENNLQNIIIDRFKKITNKIKLIGGFDIKRQGIFSFKITSSNNISLLGEKLGLKEICIRCGGHCTHPLLQSLNIDGTCRLSTYIYNSEHDIINFFDELEKNI